LTDGTQIGRGDRTILPSSSDPEERDVASNDATTKAPTAPQKAFGDVMAPSAPPVSVLTATDDGLPHGSTIRAVASLSMNQPMVLVSMVRGSDVVSVVRETCLFGLDVLTSSQLPLALKFARTGGVGMFAGVPWLLDRGVPRIPGAGVFLACRAARFLDGGDHMVVLGDVLSALSLTGRRLTYRGPIFGTHVALEASAS